MVKRVYWHKRILSSSPNHLFFFLRGSQLFWTENLISDSFHSVIASLASLKVLFWGDVWVSGNRGNKETDGDTENESTNRGVCTGQKLALWSHTVCIWAVGQDKATEGEIVHTRYMRRHILHCQKYSITHSNTKFKCSNHFFGHRCIKSST